MTCPTNCPSFTIEAIYSDGTNERVGEVYRCKKVWGAIGWKMDLANIDKRYRERVPEKRGGCEND